MKLSWTTSSIDSSIPTIYAKMYVEPHNELIWRRRMQVSSTTNSTSLISARSSRNPFRAKLFDNNTILPGIENFPLRRERINAGLVSFSRTHRHRRHFILLTCVTLHSIRKSLVKIVSKWRLLRYVATTANVFFFLQKKKPVKFIFVLCYAVITANYFFCFIFFSSLLVFYLFPFQLCSVSLATVDDSNGLHADYR